MRLLGLALLVSCHHEPGLVTPSPAAAGVGVFDAREVPATGLRIEWPNALAPLPSGTRYVAVDDAGLAAMVAVIGASPTDCDDCGYGFVDTLPLARSRACGSGCIVIGPMTMELPHARVIARRRATSPGATWRVTVSVDLDGDGRADLEQVQRCGHTMPSGCSAQVCDSYCTGTRQPGGEPARSTVSCARFVPDVDDCIP